MPACRMRFARLSCHCCRHKSRREDKRGSHHPTCDRATSNLVRVDGRLSLEGHSA